MKETIQEREKTRVERYEMQELKVRKRGEREQARLEENWRKILTEKVVKSEKRRKKGQEEKVKIPKENKSWQIRYHKRWI